MAILVTGGRGTLGRLLVPRLVSAGKNVVVTSRSASSPPSGVSLRTLDLAGAAVDPAVLDGVETIVHAASNPARTRAVDVRGTERLLDAAAAAKVAHVVYLSIVGIDDHPFPYYKAKAAAERIIEESPLPHTILRATQFHEFLDRIFGTGPITMVFPGIEFQVIDGGVVADRLVELIDAGPAGRAADIGGPRVEAMRSMAGSWKRATGSRKPIVPIAVPGKTTRAFKERRHHTPNRAEGTPTWDEWLAFTYGSH